MTSISRFNFQLDSTTVFKPYKNLQTRFFLTQIKRHNMKIETLKAILVEIL